MVFRPVLRAWCKAARAATRVRGSRPESLGGTVVTLLCCFCLGDQSIKLGLVRGDPVLCDLFDLLG